MAERTRFAAQSGTAFPIIGLGVMAAVALPLLGGGFWYVGGPLLGVLAIVFVVRRPKGTLVVVDKQGLLDRRLGVGTIPWRHVASFEPVTVLGIVYVNVFLTEAGQSIAVFPPMRRITNEVRTLLGITPVHITASGLDATPKEVISSLTVALALAQQAEPPPPRPSTRIPAR